MGLQAMHEERGAERERRIRQFEHYLGLMEHRTLRLVKADCFVVFAVPMPRALRPRLAGSKIRFVQFAFSASGFYLDLPDTTLTPEEARIVAQRPGFGFALDNPEKRLGERRFDPVQKHYQYYEIHPAAEDAAYVLFDLYKTSIDAWIKVQAQTFNGQRHWEREFSMG